MSAFSTRLLGGCELSIYESCSNELSAFICLQVKGFRSYVDLYLKDKVDETGNALKVIHEEVNPRWEVCLTLSEKGFQQVSFVNSIATTKVTLLQTIQSS